MLKFDPFVMKITIAGWPKNAKNNHAFYYKKLPFVNNGVGVGLGASGRHSISSN
jgi:hypothetical protein